MNCNLCLIGVTFLLSSIYLAINRSESIPIFTEFYSLLNDKQKSIYHGIVSERLMIYTVGVILGLINGVYYYYRFKKEKYVWCGFLTVAYATKLLFYYLYPKKPLMLYSLTTKEQTDAWAKIYETMKNRYRVSLLFGFVGYLILSFSLR